LTWKPDKINPVYYGADLIGDVFFQNMEELLDDLPKGTDHAPATIKNVLLHYL
jgi:hypothetical protein